MKPSPFSSEQAEVIQCTMEDVAGHYKMIKDLVDDNPQHLFTYLMKECVNAGTAFRMPDNSCFLYYFNTAEHKAEGRAIYGKGHPGKFLTMLLGIFGHIDLKTAKIEFHPHKGITDFKALGTLSSLHSHQVCGGPVVIRTDMLRNKFIRLMKHKGML